MLLFAAWMPAQAGDVSRLVILALRHVLFTAVVEAEDLVVEIEALHLKDESAIDAGAHLRVHLKMGEKVIVTAGPVGGPVERRGGRRVGIGVAAYRDSGGGGIVLVCEDVGAVIRHAHMHLVATQDILRVNIEGVLRGSHQRRRIRAIRKAVDARIVVGIIRYQAQAAESAGQAGEFLLQAELQPPDKGVIAIGVLLSQGTGRRTWHHGQTGAGARNIGSHDRIGQLFIEEPSLNQAKGLQFLFQKQIVVVGVRGFLTGASDGSHHGVIAAGQNIRHQVVLVRPGDAARIDRGEPLRT